MISRRTRRSFGDIIAVAAFKAMIVIALWMALTGTASKPPSPQPAEQPKKDSPENQEQERLDYRKRNREA